MKHEKHCFVIQTFDGGEFDARYNEIIAPTVIASGLKPLRADTIISDLPIIDTIEQSIRQSQCCIADISTDNPNVWYELGYALALSKPTIMLCKRNARTSLPFDIQHRPILFYNSDSPNDFIQLENQLKETIASILNQSSTATTHVPLRKTDPLDPLAIQLLTALMTLASKGFNGVTVEQLSQNLSLALTESECCIALMQLESHGFVRCKKGEHEVNYYAISRHGKQWLVENPSLVGRVAKQYKRQPA